MPALPFVLVTAQLDVFSESGIEQGKLPAGTESTKLYWSACVDSLRNELFSVKETLGAAATEEWLKGLEGRGKQHRILTSKWEKFAASGGIDQMRNLRPAAHVSLPSIAPAVAYQPSLQQNTSQMMQVTDGTAAVTHVATPTATAASPPSLGMFHQTARSAHICLQD